MKPAEDGSHIAPFNPYYYFTNRLPYDITAEDGYVPGTTNATTSSKAWQTNQWLLECVGNDPNKLAALKTLIGNSLIRTYEKLQAVVLIVGEGEDGKSTFLSYLQDDLLGRENTHNLSLEQLLGKQGGSNYNQAELYHTLANIYADISRTKRTDVLLSTIKILMDGGKIDARRKFRSNLRFRPYAKLWFACNVLPRMSGLGYDEKRRFIVFKWHRIDGFQKRFSLDKIREERGYFMFECLEEFKTYLERRQAGQDQLEALQISNSMKQNYEDFKTLGDPVVAFVKSACVEAEDKYVAKGDLFEAFKDWCDQFGHKLAANFTQTAFSRKVATLGFKTKMVKQNGKSTRGFVGPALLPDAKWRDYDDIMLDED